MNPTPLYGYLYAIISALLFGASTPAAKYLLGEIDPWILAGLLYLASGLGLLIIFLLRLFISKSSVMSRSHNKPPKQQWLKSSDWKWLLGASLFGGILAPVFLLYGLVNTPASVTSLLLNLESVFTALLAWIIFKEITDRKNIIAVSLIIMGSIIIAWKAWPNLNNLLGTIFISLACLFWAIDNNMIQKISRSDPVSIISIKSIIAGITNLILGFMIKGSLSITAIALVESAIIGIVCYGLSMLFFVLALRYIGASRTGAYYSLAPFIGVIFSVLFLKETLSLQILMSGILMALGVFLHMTEVFKHVLKRKML